MNKIVIITGATSGYGLATAEKFQKEGRSLTNFIKNQAAFLFGSGKNSG